MNLYLRLIWTGICSFFRPRIAYTEKASLSLIILPNDLDLNNHLNNGRYLTLLDLASIDFFLRCGVFNKLFKKGLKPIVGGIIVTYLKGLSLFERCTLTMQLEAWDDRWNYFRFEFVNSQGVVSAAGYFKGALVSKKGFFPTQDLFELLEFTYRKCKLPPAVSHWIESENNIMADQLG